MTENRIFNPAVYCGGNKPTNGKPVATTHYLLYFQAEKYNMAVGC